jgi:hypothetical protein
MVVHTYNPSSWEAKTGGCRVQGQCRLHCETLSQKHKNQKQNKMVFLVCHCFHKKPMNCLLIVKIHQRTFQNMHIIILKHEGGVIVWKMKKNLWF